MILSVSRRTDIPAFYSKWFINRINEGFLYVINPFNRKQVSKIELNQDTIDLFVFWTKDPEPMISSLDILDNKGFKYYFQFTLNSYARDIEKGINISDVKGKNDYQLPKYTYIYAEKNLVFESEQNRAFKFEEIGS